MYGHLYEEPGAVRLTEAECGNVEWRLPGAGKGGNGKLLFKKYRASVLQYKKSYRDGWWW